MKPYNKIALLVFLFILIEALLIGFIDQPLSEYMRSLDIEHKTLIDFFRAYTDIGKGKWYIGFTGVGIFVCALILRIKTVRMHVKLKAQKIGEACLFIFLCVASSGIFADILKPLVGRARPVVLDREGIFGFQPFSTFNNDWKSWPSGHSTTALAVMIALITLFPRWKYLWFACAFALCLSRIMVNAHYLGDVIAGCAVGMGTAIFVRNHFNNGSIRRINAYIFPIDQK